MEEVKKEYSQMNILYLMRMSKKELESLYKSLNVKTATMALYKIRRSKYLNN